MSEKVIELVHLQKQFGENTGLRDIHLSVSKAETLSIKQFMLISIMIIPIYQTSNSVCGKKALQSEWFVGA